MSLDATTYLAIYGAVVATGSGYWNVRAYRKANVVKVSIEGEARQFAPAVFDQGTNVAQGVRFRVKNRGSFPVEVTDVGFGVKGSGSMNSFVPEGLGEVLPVTIAPGDIADFPWRTASSVIGREVRSDWKVISELTNGTPFVLRLADGKKIWAKPWRLETQTTFSPVKSNLRERIGRHR